MHIYEYNRKLVIYYMKDTYRVDLKSILMYCLSTYVLFIANTIHYVKRSISYSETVGFQMHDDNIYNNDIHYLLQWYSLPSMMVLPQLAKG